MSKITEEIAREFAGLHTQGITYREIGRRFGVDWRTVKARIERAKQSQEMTRWEAVSRDVYAGLLREHLSLLVHVAFGVLSGVKTEPLFARQDQGPEVLLERLLESTVDEALQVLRKRGVDPDVPQSISLPDVAGVPAKQRMVKRLMGSLTDHDPGLKLALDAWGRSWKEFQRLRGQFSDQAEGLVTNSGPGEAELASSLGHGLAEGVLQAELLGQTMMLPSVEESGSGRCSVVLLVDVRTEKLCVGSRVALEEVLSTVLRTVLPQIQLDERLRSVRESYIKVCTNLAVVEELVDTIVLRGYPLGSCSLCLSDIVNRA